MRLFAIFLLVLCLAFLSCPVFAADSCKQTTHGQCYSVHGRYAIYVENDGIWVIGTKRLLLASNDNLDKEIRDKGDWLDYAVIGDFTVCPLSKLKEGRKQIVCIQSYKNTRIVKWDHNSE